MHTHSLCHLALTAEQGIEGTPHLDEHCPGSPRSAVLTAGRQGPPVGEGLLEMPRASKASRWSGQASQVQTEQTRAWPLLCW